jgi:hypothetical protein
MEERAHSRGVGILCALQDSRGGDVAILGARCREALGALALACLRGILFTCEHGR